SPDPTLTSTRSSSRGSDSEQLDLDDEREPASGPQRPRSVPSAGTTAKVEKEKRKRSRVTPEQLVHLERFFALDRSPPAARRREISERLGMQERQTQIWFQNRRAKAKLQDGRTGRGKSAELPPDSPPQLSTGFEVDLHNLIHEDEPVTIIPCTDLSIGSWRRIATTVGKHDLVAYICEVKRCLTWFIHSAGLGFKMEIPFDTIIDAEFTNAAPGTGLASFLLSQPPLFFLEQISSPRPDGSVLRQWRTCPDWTEGHQASQVLRHDLIGSAVQLSHFLRNLRNSTRPDVPLRPANSYRPAPAPPVEMSRPNPPMELPLPPMASLNDTSLSNTSYHYQGDVDLPPSLGRRDVDRKRLPYPVAGLTTHTPDRFENHDRPPHSAPLNGSFPQHTSYTAISQQGAPASTSFGNHMYNSYAPEARDVGHNSQQSSRDEYSAVSAVRISHDMASRSYPSIPTRPFYDDVNHRLAQPFQPRRSHSSASGRVNPYDQNATSPPLLTTPYHP
ncbi:homeobox-domain-containing protein, partial [Tricholoma matsutake]